KTGRRVRRTTHCRSACQSTGYRYDRNQQKPKSGKKIGAYGRQVSEDRGFSRSLSSAGRKPAARSRSRHGASGSPRPAELSRGLDRRASLRRVRDHCRPELFIAGAAERTRHIRLGTGVVSLPYHNPFTLAGRMMQLDYRRGRAMFGVGPGSLVYDAVKMGLNPQDQRRKLDEALDVIVELMRGRAVTKQTDWFDLHEARLQLKSYSQPMMEMAVASNRSPVGALAAGQHHIGMLSIGGTSDDALKAHANNWGVYEQSAKAAGKTPDRRKWRILPFPHAPHPPHPPPAHATSPLHDS